MKKNVFLVLCISFICFGCSAEAEWEKLKVKEVVKTDPVIDWSATADSCTYVLIEQFMNKEKGTFWKSPKDVSGGSYNIYWQQAHAMDVVIYSYERIKDKNPALAATYKNYFKLWFDNKANNYHHSDSDETGFLNPFTDDMCWICLTLIHLSEATGDAVYINMAKNIYDTHIITRAWTDAKGTGLPWKSDDKSRNACTNSPGCLVAAKLYRKFGDFDFNATLGGNVYKVNNQTTVTTAQDMKIRDVPSLTSFNEISVVPGSYRKQINSVYGAVNVGWKHMLYLDATLRGDQSSTLPTGNNMYMYPSFSGSFVFSELTKLGDLLPYGKVRMSWAQVGSDTDPYQLGLVYTKSKYAYPGYTIGYIDNGTIPNKDLKPTKTNSVEMGLELKFLKNRIGLDFTYYSQISKKQIMGMASSWTTGYNYRLINAGKIENKGIEIALSTRPIQTRDFSWDINLNFSKNSNKVKELDGESDMFELEKASWLDVQVAAKVGENFGSIVGPDFQRNEKGDILIDPQTGLPQYDKSNHVLGNASWDWTGGLLTNFTYKNLSLVAVFDVKVGADLYSMSARAAYESGKSPETLAGRDAWYRSEEERLAAGIAKGADNWKPTGGFVAPGVIDNGDGTYRPNDIYINPEDYWMSVCRNAPSMFIYDNSYVKCRELTLSYNVPKSWLKNVISGLTVSFVARNPFIVWKNIPNIDPDSNYNNTTGMGLEYGSLPSRRSYGFNVNVKF